MVTDAMVAPTIIKGECRKGFPFHGGFTHLHVNGVEYTSDQVRAALAHPDQTSPMTVGPEAYLDEAVREDAGLIEIATALELSVEWLEIDPVAEERRVVDRVRDALKLTRARVALTAAQEGR